MATYSPPAFPRRPKVSTVFSELAYQCHLTYYRYEINTALYVMSPGEKLAFNIILFSILVLLLSAVYYYLPAALTLSAHRLGYYYTGANKLHVTGLTGSGDAGILQNSREALASLADAGTKINATSVAS